MKASKRPKPDAPSLDLAKARAWLESYPKVSTWMARHDLPALLEAGGGIAKIQNFFPGFVAEAVLHALERVPAARWNATAANQDYAQNNISHEFWSTKRAGRELEAAMRALTLLLPGRLHAFSAARYDGGHHIAPHDDRAYTPVRMDTGEVVTCSRDVAVIYYLTQGWTRAHGGSLVDLETGTTHVPEFNSAIAFRVPRMHEVTPLTAPAPRYSLFGWFLQPGQLYRVGAEEAAEKAAAEAAAAGDSADAAAAGGSADAAAAGGRTKKKKKKKRRRQPEQVAERELPKCKLARRMLERAAGENERGASPGD